jgi:uncharacterized protein with PQ loop repeat
MLDGTRLLAVDTTLCSTPIPANAATNTHGTRALADSPLEGMRARHCRMRVIGMKNADLLGWISSFILLVTLLRQVYVQWKSESVAGVSKWLFVGQLAASTGYTIYSFLLHNWVYVCSNIAILLTALLGQGLYLRNRRVAVRRRQPSAGASGDRPASIRH